MNFFVQKRRKDTHKGDYGHLFILGGSPGLTGAVCLAGKAAMRSGCGLVTIGIPTGLNAIIEMKLTEAMSLPLSETSSGTFSAKAAGPAFEFINDKADAVLIGPGISTLEETAEFVKTIIDRTEKPLVIDADAITVISGMKPLLKKSGGRIILTPHPGEMSRLTGLAVEDIQKRREETAKAFAKKHDVTVILKGHRTVISDGKNTCINLTGNPGMATAGSGDVLAGIAGSLLARGYGTFESAKCAAYIHGLAGDLAAKETGETPLIASDIIGKLPSAFNYAGRKTG